MARIGIELSTRVAVRLVAPDTLEFRPGTLHLGVTTSETVDTGGPSTVVGIEVAGGLPGVYFGAIVAHELGHARLIQRGAVDLEPMLAEGTCDLFASAWLKRQKGTLAGTLREAIANSPDPVYGAGYRMVRDAVLRHGVAAVLDSVCRRRTLP